MRMRVWAALAAGALAAAPGAVSGQFESVGTLSFPTSATGEAQRHFLRGVAILHSFGWKQAIEEFHAAQAIDPDFAMAYWGESLAYNHPLFSQMDPTQPRAALLRLGATSEERLAKAPTAREKGFLAAVEVLWGEGDHVARRVGYMQAMEWLHRQYPDDPEVAAFYALSMLSAAQTDTGAPPPMAMSMPMDRGAGSAPMPMPGTAGEMDHAAMGGEDTSSMFPLSVAGQRERLNVRAGAITLDLFARLPDHPGAAHYTIHAFDDPLHAPIALRAAYRYADIAPSVAHAIHMPTHIFIQHGMWQLVAEQNKRAYDVARDLWMPGDALDDAIHALDWGQYGDLQRGDYAEAELWIRRLQSLAVEGRFLGSPRQGEAGDARAVATLDLLRARYVVDAEAWEVREVTPDLSPNALLATALSAYHLGDAASLRAAASAASSGRGTTAEIVSKEIEALMHASMGHLDPVVSAMEEASAIVATLPPPNGAASPVKPVHELYGELLLELGRPDLAVPQLQRSLELMPNRPRSLLGLGRAFVALGAITKAGDPYETLAELWAGREELEGMQEARRFWRMYLASNRGHMRGPMASGRLGM